MAQVQKDDARQRILRSALKIISNCGYEGASIQEIVKAAKVTKPTLYYYFGSKEGLHSALVDWAQDERFDLMQRTVAKHRGFRVQLTALLEALFRFARDHREFTRVCFATAFAAPGEIPNQQQCRNKGSRNFEFVHQLIKEGIAAGELTSSFRSQELAAMIYSQITFYLMSQLLDPKQSQQRQEAKRIIQLFFNGAGSSSSSKRNE
jgi:AcrR family transcriptional regulator